MGRWAFLLTVGICCASAQPKKATFEHRWDNQPSGVDDDLKAVFFVDTSAGWVAGSNNTILRTTNGGKTWQRLLERQERNDFLSVAFTSATDGWVQSRDVLLHTKDGGESWQAAVPLPRGGGFGGSSMRGTVRYQLRTHGLGAGVCSTTDGKTWTEQGEVPSNAYVAVFFVDERNGWLSGDYGLLASTADGGAKWTAREPPLKANFAKIQFVTPQIGWLLPHRGHQGGLLATTDGGATWNTQFAGLATYSPIHDMQFLDAQHGFLLAEGPRAETVLATSNGGKNWRTIGNLAQYRAGALSFPKLDEGWTVGQKGTIYHYHRVELK